MSERAVQLILLLQFSFALVFISSAMLSSSIPLSDVDDTTRAMQWLDTQMEGDSALLVHDAFLPWSELYLSSERTIVHFKTDLTRAVDLALKRGLGHIYLVWWKENIRWYDLSVPEDFQPTFSSGRISVFEYLRQD